MGLLITEEAVQLGLLMLRGPLYNEKTQTCELDFFGLPPITRITKVTSMVPGVELLQRPLEERLVVLLLRGLECYDMSLKLPHW